MEISKSIFTFSFDSSTSAADACECYWTGGGHEGKKEGRKGREGGRESVSQGRRGGRERE